MNDTKPALGDGGDACENPGPHPPISDEPPIPDKEDLPGEPRPTRRDEPPVRNAQRSG